MIRYIWHHSAKCKLVNSSIITLLAIIAEKLVTVNILSAIYERRYITQMSIYRLRFFFDYGSGICFWADTAATNERFHYPIDVKQLPLSVGLQEATLALLDQYDQSINWNDPGGKGLWTTDQRQEFDELVRQLLTEVRQELGSDYEIVDQHYPIDTGL